MAKKKLMTYREWQQKEAARKAKAADTRRARKQAERAAWWAETPAQGNYIELKAHVATREDTPNLGKVSVTGRVLPDKRQADRRWSALSISLMLRGDADREAIARQLTDLASLVLMSEEPWRTAAGAPVPQPMRIDGLPIQLVPTPFRSTTPERPSPTVDSRPAHDASPFHGLLTLRTQLHRWLSAHRTDESPLALLTVEQLAEVLLMRVCGDDIALVSERDPWRWDHTAEELLAADVALAAEIQTLSGIVTDLNRRLGPEAAIEVLLTVFVQGQGG